MPEQRRTTTIRELLNRLFPNQDAEVDMTDLQALQVNSVENLNNNTVQVPEVKNNVKEVKENKEDKKVAVRYDANTGLFDLSGVEDEELKAQLKLSNDTVKANKNKALIEKAVSDKMNTIKLIDGITSDVVLNLLDRNNIKVKDGVVEGVDDAFNNLMTAQAGLFVKEQTKEVKQVQKQVSSPINEGFAPINNTTARGKLSFAEAIASKEQ